MQDYITRQEYQRTNKEFMSEIKNIKNKINEIENAVLKLPEKITETMEKRYVSKDAFDPVRNIAYGLVAGVCLGFIGLIIYLIVRNIR